jgi:NTP pyrophosphatase (non-canonical NTP hydrolase)
MLDYQTEASKTDRMPENSLETPLLGLFGEVGSLLSELKKKRRDNISDVKYNEAVIEELGDVLWYFAIIISRAGLDITVLAQRMFQELSDWDEVEHKHWGTFGDIQSQNDGEVSDEEFGKCLVDLAGKIGDLVKDFNAGKFTTNRDLLSAHLVEIFKAIVAAADAVDVSLEDAAYQNLRKIFSRWPIAENYAPLIDTLMPIDEQLLRKFEIYFEEQKVNHKTYVIQKCNGIIIGDRLTDNKQIKDDYRFHDVFHIAFAVYLGWSPVLRALFHLKRKSVSETDENQDGARAILIEEGVATFIFGYGLKLNLYKNATKVEYDLLKSIKKFVEGYEVQRCALWQWEKAIINGFKVFNELKKHRKGYVFADLEAHTLEFKLEKDPQ